LYLSKINIIPDSIFPFFGVIIKEAFPNPRLNRKELSYILLKEQIICNLPLPFFKKEGYLFFGYDKSLHLFPLLKGIEGDY
jgi:hypothetical protein